MLAGGCFRGSLPVLRQYRLVVPDSTAEAHLLNGSAYTPPLTGSLAILAYDAPGLYADRNIVYRVGETEYGTYPSSLWALPLEHMLGVITAQVLRTTPLSVEQTVFDPPSRRGYDYTWQGTIRE